MDTQSTTYFLTSVEAILSNWTALQLAVSQSAAGHSSREIGSWMAGAVVSWFQENKNIEFYEATEMLDCILNQEFNVILEDGSSDEVGRLLCDFYSLIFVQGANENTILSRMQALPKCDLSKCKIEDPDANIAATTTDNDNIESMEVEPKKSTPKAMHSEPDENGWITVPTRNKK